MFDRTSRYAALDDATIDVAQPDGTERTIRFKRRRFLPRRDSMTTLVEHSFADGERLDILTARYAGDPTQFWRLCDANDVLRPDELERPGRILDVAIREALTDAGEHARRPPPAVDRRHRPAAAQARRSWTP